MPLKLKQYYIYQLSTFSFLTEKENEQVDEIRKYSGEDLKAKKLEFANMLNQFTGVRTLRNPKSLQTGIDSFIKNKKTNLVSIFESDLTRWIVKNKPEFIEQLGQDKNLLKGIVFVKIAMEQLPILQQMVMRGVVIDGLEYVVYTASAGQQRDKKITLLEKSVMDGYVKAQYMCGLSVEDINHTGGINAGKYLAYLSLPMSASLPINIDIDRCIVVNDMELHVNKPVEFIDHEKGFSHQQIVLPDALDMTDGCGMMLPGAMQEIQRQLGINYPPTGFQIRGPWIKGAVFPFDFQAFCKEKGLSVITDLWGQQHNVIAEDIQIILTKSQLKLWSKYNSWEHYKSEFKKCGLTFSVTAVNNPDKDEIQLAYQFIQTLDRDKADGEHIKALCSRSLNYYKALHSDKDIILKQFGACEENEHKKPFQEALMLYPALLNDQYVRSKIEKMVAGFKRELLCGKLLVNGLYGYAMPDLYAFCEWLFLGEKNPKVLIPDDYVYCRYYENQNIQETDILRSPCLSNEHSPRKILHSNDCKNWFGHCGQNVIYSVHDYLMLAVMGDVDGDALAVVPDKTLLDMVKPHNREHHGQAEPCVDGLGFDESGNLIEVINCNNMEIYKDALIN